MADRKTRSDAWWAPLDEEARWEAYHRTDALPLHAGVKWLREEKGIETSVAGLQRFQADMRPRLQAWRMEQAVRAGKDALQLARAAGARKDVADALLAMGTDIALRTGDAKTASLWMRMSADIGAAMQKDREIELRAEAQRLDREKFEAAEKRLAAVKSAVEDARRAPGGLTPETLKRIEEAAGLL